MHYTDLRGLWCTEPLLSDELELFLVVIACRSGNGLCLLVLPATVLYAQGDSGGTEVDIPPLWDLVRYTPKGGQTRRRSVCPLRADCVAKVEKLQGSDFFAKTRNGKQSTICIISIALPKSPVSFARGDEVPHIFTRKPRLQPAEFLITGAKRLLQHNLPIAAICTAANRLAIRSPRRPA